MDYNFLQPFNFKSLIIMDLFEIFIHAIIIKLEEISREGANFSFALNIEFFPSLFGVSL